MKNLQLRVDIDLNSGNMESQTSNQGFAMKSQANAVKSTSEGAEFSTARNSRVIANKNQIEKLSERILKDMGFDISKIKAYLFGKDIAFALCYGASCGNAINIGMKNVGRNSLHKLLSNQHKLNSFLRNPKLLDTYNDVVSCAFSGDVETAKTHAVNIWKKSLGKNIVEDSDILKSLINSGCIQSGCGVQSTEDKALEFIEYNLNQLCLESKII